VKSLTEHLWFEVPDRRGFINITPKIEELVHRSGVMEGLFLQIQNDFGKPAAVATANQDG
jgi:thiamine phosphate synthase YjbQ (UPF0047 family)